MKKQSQQDKELTAKLQYELQQRKKEFYNAGLNGKVLQMVPNLTIGTTSEEEAQMIESAIDKFCEQDGCDAPSPDLREAMRLLDKICIVSYRDGLSARSLSKECSLEK